MSIQILYEDATRAYVCSDGFSRLVSCGQSPNDHNRETESIVQSTKAALFAKLNSRSAHVAVIGLGYVGLPLAVALAEAGYTVTGIDKDANKVASVNRGESYIEDIPSPLLKSVMVSSSGPPTTDRGSLHATGDFSALASCDAVSICVPTPLNKTGDPDISYVVSAAEEIAQYLHSGMVVVLESTTFPGTTTEIVRPMLEPADGGFQIGQDLFLAFSPERIDPGRTDWTVETMPKLIGGVTPDCLEIATAFYGAIIQKLVPVSSPEVAEMAKLFENTFRTVNIGLANECLLMCEKLGLDAWEVIDAAATKPFGFMRFTPGPGLGGHCLPIDPHYLSWKLRGLKYKARFIELASEINSEMPIYWVRKIQDRLNDVCKPLRGSRLLVLGVAYKKNVSDLRESPALDIIHLLTAQGASVEYHDPHVPSFDVETLAMTSVPDLPAAIAQADCVVIVTDHDAYDWPMIRANGALIVDTRHVLAS